MSPPPEGDPPNEALGAAERAAVADFVDWVRRRFAGRVSELTLFGSRARRDHRPDSDVDILIVVDDLTSAERREIARQSGDAVTDWSVSLSPFAMSSAYIAELRARERRVAREIDRDGIAL
jgi:predicted nucleotidyltransferase